MFQDDIRQLQELARTQPWRSDDRAASAGEVFTASFDQVVSEEQSISRQRWLKPQLEHRERQVIEAFGEENPEAVRDVLGAYFDHDPQVFRKLRSLVDEGEIVIGEGAVTDSGLPDFGRGRETTVVERGRARSQSAFGFGPVDLPESPWQISYESPRARQYARRYWPALQAMLTVEAMRQADPRIQSDEQIDEHIRAMAEIMRESNQDVMGRRQGVTGGLALFGGTMLGVLTDPPIAASMFAGTQAVRGPSIAKNMARAFGIEAGIATAVEVPVQSMVFGFKREIESPWTKGDAAFNVLAAAVGAGGARGVASGLIDVSQVVRAGAPMRLVEAERLIAEQLDGPLNIEAAQRMITQYQRGVSDGSVRPTEDADRAVGELQEWIDVAGEARLDQSMGGLEEHFTRVELAMDDIASGRPTRVIPAEERPAVPGGREAETSNLQVIDPEGIEVDAERFQFKAFTDEDGVSDRLRGVERFDQRLAGVALVYEQADGRRFIVDGHQRLALARRARAGGQAADETRLSAFLLREVDGVSAGDARAVAAIKNIAEGTGSATDAAKILREMGPMGEQIMPEGLPPLPPNSALVRQARGLAKLSDDSFDLVINDVIPESYASIVGDRILDPQQQAAVIRLLARTDPANQTQATMIVEQARAVGFERRVTEDLFGEREVAESLFLERAKVLDAALRALRRDRQTFRTVVSRETELLEQGNVLDQQANQTRLAQDSELETTIAATANRVGPVSDALNDAARRVRDGARPATVASDFLRALRAEGLRDPAPGPRTGRAGPEPEVGLITRAFELDGDGAKLATDNFKASQQGRSLDEMFEGRGATASRDRR
jgi:hypothetical protein